MTRHQYGISALVSFLQPLSSSSGLFRLVHANPTKKIRGLKNARIHVNGDILKDGFSESILMSKDNCLDLCSLWHASQTSNCTYAWQASNAGIFGDPGAVSRFGRKGVLFKTFVTSFSADPTYCPWVSEGETWPNERELNRFCSSCLLIPVWFGTCDVPLSTRVFTLYQYTG